MITNSKANEIESIFDKCTSLNERMSSYMKGIEGLRLRLFQTLPVNKTEQELLSLLSEHFKTVLADLMILKDILFEVATCENDYTELQNFLEMNSDSEKYN